MAEQMKLSFLATTASKIDELPIVDGQFILIKDINTIAVDMNDKRTKYEQIITLASDSDRSSILAPVNGIFYFVVETNSLWKYDQEWQMICSAQSLVPAGGSSGQVLTKQSDTNGDVSWQNPSVSDEQVTTAVNLYLEENPVSGMTAEQEQQLNQNTTDVADLKSALEQIGQKGYVTEDDIPEKLPSPGTLTFTGAVNDTYDGSADKTINIPTGGGEGGITVALKNALLNLASVVVYKDETSGASAYSALESALSQEVSNITLLKISVVCSASEVAEKTTADELRKYLTVTAIYSDKSSEVVNDYDLEGTVAIGENTFIVTYNEKSATFMITGVKSDSSDSFVKDITKVADVSMNTSTGSDMVYAIYNVKAGDIIEYWASWSPSQYSPPKYYDHNPIVEGVDYTQSQTAYGGASLPVDSSEYTHTVLVEYSYGKVTFNPEQDYACVVIRTNTTESTFSEVGATWKRN